MGSVSGVNKEASFGSVDHGLCGLVPKVGDPRGLCSPYPQLNPALTGCYA